MTIGGLNLTATGTLSLSGSALTVAAPVIVAASQTLASSGTVNGTIDLLGGTLGPASGTMTVGGNVLVSGYGTTNSMNNVTLSGGSVTVTNTNTLVASGTIGAPIVLGTFASPAYYAILQGSFTAGGNMTVGSYGWLEPGTGAATGSGHTLGTITISGSNTLTTSSGAGMTFNLGATGQSDKIVVGGTVSLNNPAAYVYNMGTIPLAGGNYTLMTYANTASPGTLNVGIHSAPGTA